ncbi:PadR family transcriptional regulator [Spirosoma endophyticum]|uniref:Transcriptional regulator PadR-like family protein n=1 Tax=Spirosoma endophyticum TaxID=662367 RepID=A0A1I1ZM84_9BACT|nr:helix-turn-helix transcriptional regulator [Spirosoma endophyticum]SFE32799.1 Transcriptional regulator PadR-like family protein [Spirosoma endophyticum]
MKRVFLGELEEVVLLTVATLQEAAYCALITQTIDQQMGRSISFPTVHTTLQRLAEKGFVSSQMGGATPERGGRQKRLFRVTTVGQRALIESRQLRSQLWNQIPTEVVQLWGA